MHYNFFLSDLHLHHKNILSFTDSEGNLIRGKDFKTIEEHDDLIIENINKKVRIQDKLYILGDVAMHKKALPIIDRINTKKRILLLGNHDQDRTKEYLKYFKAVRAYKIMPGEGIIFSHIPIHENGLQGRWRANVHGHLHQNELEDKRYINICCEQTNYQPLELEEIKEIMNERVL